MSTTAANLLEYNTSTYTVDRISSNAKPALTGAPHRKNIPYKRNYGSTQTGLRPLSSICVRTTNVHHKYRRRWHVP